MSSIIQTLPLDVINLIAAGEVIDSLAAVVRELVENSLDAGSSRITVSLLPNLWQLQVRDNGKGMSVEDLRLCTNAHSTSKIRDRKDLWQIKSLGFRGEALHSIAQVAELEIFSRAATTTETGWRVAYQAGKPITEEVVAIAPGTIITVANLFGNIPVRRHALPAVTQQIKLVQNIIYQLALTHPGITWQIWQNQKPWFNLSPGMTAKDILPQILKRISLTDLQSVKLDLAAPEDLTAINPQIKSHLELVIGLPDRCHRHRPDWVKIAVNGRIVRVPEIEQTMIASMAKTLPRDRYPVSFVHLHLPSSLVDWNRHPAKTEIYLHCLPHWQQQISQAIETALRITPANLPVATANQRVSKLLKVAEAKSNYNCQPKNQLNLIELKAVAQINKTYIVVEHSNGLWLVEQHIAHERVLYEQIQANWQLIPLQTPIILNNLKSFQVEQLQRLNIEIEPFGEEIWAIRNAPSLLAQRDDCHDALIELSLGGDLQSAQVATACRSAIRNGTPLSLPEMQNLIDRWQATRNPRTCPHGRPIYLSLEETSLARFFRRHWVIGKSHGI